MERSHIQVELLPKKYWPQNLMINFFRNCYSSIFQGNWEHFKPFLVNGRGQSIMDKHCSFFRAFQGWTALTSAGPGSGTLKLLPILKETISYLLLKPLMSNEKTSPFPGKVSNERKQQCISLTYLRLSARQVVLSP